MDQEHKEGHTCGEHECKEGKCVNGVCVNEEGHECEGGVCTHGSSELHTCENCGEGCEKCKE